MRFSHIPHTLIQRAKSTKGRKNEQTAEEAGPEGPLDHQAEHQAKQGSPTVDAASHIKGEGLAVAPGPGDIGLPARTLGEGEFSPDDMTLAMLRSRLSVEHGPVPTTSVVFSAASRAQRSLSNIAQGVRYESYAAVRQAEKRLASIAEGVEQEKKGAEKTTTTSSGFSLPPIPEMDWSLEAALSAAPTASDAQVFGDEAQAGEEGAYSGKGKQMMCGADSGKFFAHEGEDDVPPAPPPASTSSKVAEEPANASASRRAPNKAEVRRYRTPTEAATSAPPDTDPALHFVTQCYSHGRPLFTPPPPKSAGPSTVTDRVESCALDVPGADQPSESAAVGEAAPKIASARDAEQQAGGMRRALKSFRTVNAKLNPLKGREQQAQKKLRAESERKRLAELYGASDEKRIERGMRTL